MINTNGRGFSVLHTFTALDAATQTTNNDGANPLAGLIISGNTLYGTAQYGGTNANGTVFKVSTNGNAFVNLYNFTGGDKLWSKSRSWIDYIQQHPVWNCALWRP